MLDEALENQSSPLTGQAQTKSYQSYYYQSLVGSHLKKDNFLQTSAST